VKQREMEGGAQSLCVYVGYGKQEKYEKAKKNEGGEDRTMSDLVTVKDAASSQHVYSG